MSEIKIDIDTDFNGWQKRYFNKKHEHEWGRNLMTSIYIEPDQKNEETMEISSFILKWSACTYFRKGWAIKFQNIGQNQDASKT